MDGYAQRQCGSKLWIIVYAVVRNGVITVSEDKESFLRGDYLKALSLEKIAIYLDNAIDKKLVTVFYIQIKSENQQDEVTLGFRFTETRNEWYYTLLTEHAKLFIERAVGTESGDTRTPSKSPSRISLGKIMGLPSSMREKLNFRSFSGIVGKRSRTESFNFEALRRPENMYAAILKP